MWLGMVLMVLIGIIVVGVVDSDSNRMGATRVPFEWGKYMLSLESSADAYRD